MKVARIALAGGVIAMLAASMMAAGAGGGETAAGDPVRGKKVYNDANPKCSLCHKIGTVGGKFGPDLSDIGRKRDVAFLTKYLPNPRFLDPANKMPAVGAKGKDLDDLIAYLVSLKGKPGK